jgi:O-methyltransferase involved in polyketide biosynthesis
LHYALRKLCIEQITKEFLDAAQVEQLVVIAAGFDPLTAMLSQQYTNFALNSITPRHNEQKDRR